MPEAELDKEQPTVSRLIKIRWESSLSVRSKLIGCKAGRRVMDRPNHFSSAEAGVENEQGRGMEGLVREASKHIGPMAYFRGSGIRDERESADPGRAVVGR